MHHFGRLFWAEVEVVGVGEDLACATDAHAVMREVQRRQGDVLAEDVVPHVELGPVVQGEDPEVLAWRVHAIEQVPELRTLVLGVPLAEVVAVGEEAFLRTGLFLVATAPPMQASNWCSSMVSMRVVVWRRLRLALAPVSSCTLPESMVA